jgi:SRSO17 transposase
MNNTELSLQELENSFCKTVEKFTLCFKRTTSLAVGTSYVKGLLSKIERKNSWQIAEGTESVTPYKYQHLINRGGFDQEMARDLNQQLVIENLGTNGILAIDETGFLKKGDKSAGVQRQYSGTAGRIENCQLGVFGSYKTSKGHALIDRELYIPESWTVDKERCKEAGIGEDIKFQTKPELGTMIYNKFAKNGHKASWVTADEAYGRDPKFRQNLEESQQNYVLAIPRDTVMRIGMLKFKAEIWGEKIGAEEWKRLSCGKGTKGERVYDWAVKERSEKCEAGFARYLLIRRSISDAKELSFYTVYANIGVSLEEMVIAAGSRWSIEECFEMAKGETGLDQYEFRTMPGWYRHITLSMIALSILCISRSNLLLPVKEVGSGEMGSMEEFKKKRQMKD